MCWHCVQYGGSKNRLMTKQEWRNIPGYGGAYQINQMAEVRCWKWRGQRTKTPHFLTQYRKKPRGKGRRSGRYYFKLTDPGGKSREVAVISRMVDVWLGGRPPGKVAYHRNGDLADSCLHNIAFTTPRELGVMTGAQSSRRPVEKIDMSGEVVEVYPSARAAARANHMSYQAVLDRCNGKVKNPYALDGHNYRFDA